MNLRPLVSEAKRGFEAVDASGAVRGSVVFDGWCPSSAHVHIESDTAIALRRLLPAAIRLGFEQLGLSVVLAPIRATSKAHELAKRIGFRFVHRIHDGWAANEDLYLYELRPEWCRYRKAG